MKHPSVIAAALAVAFAFTTFAADAQDGQRVRVAIESAFPPCNASTPTVSCKDMT